MIVICLLLLFKEAGKGSSNVQFHHCTLTPYGDDKPVISFMINPRYSKRSTDDFQLNNMMLSYASTSKIFR